VYIHLNPRYYAAWVWSSYPEYIEKRSDEWVHPELVLADSEKGGAYAKTVDFYAAIDQRKRYIEIEDQIVF
jgi:hypothetical protein